MKIGVLVKAVLCQYLQMASPDSKLDYIIAVGLVAGNRGDLEGMCWFMEGEVADLEEEKGLADWHFFMVESFRRSSDFPLWQCSVGMQKVSVLCVALR